ncbi:zinc ribbon domain-containing protein [Alkalicoccus halolimnae]|uniref:Zinc ribbon domain-containing protein n=1 Tax=Alkalicoccus halolimnae TaxID=1667239 RepID=A0A5C7F5C9_9BACI|nr:zinc ribbon domain-containing protein [Alkalicoccus halolimnae]TXF85303.1 zinc ribbon domain-containing protein [Alkalicoccus halolimnae]
MSKYCTKCGETLNEQAKFCSYCGLKQENSSPIEPPHIFDDKKMAKEVLNLTPIDESINLGVRGQFYLNKEEECYFKLQDVDWMEMDPRENLFDTEASGTLYLTNKQILLYDPGYSNFWTRLSIKGDFKEQVKSLPITEVKGLAPNIPIGSSGKYGTRMAGLNCDVLLSPSSRKYHGRTTPITNVQPEMEKFCALVEKLIIFNEHINSR